MLMVFVIHKLLSVSTKKLIFVDVKVSTNVYREK